MPPHNWASYWEQNWKISENQLQKTHDWECIIIACHFIILFWFLLSRRTGNGFWKLSLSKVHLSPSFPHEFMNWNCSAWVIGTNRHLKIIQSISGGRATTSKTTYLDSQAISKVLCLTVLTLDKFIYPLSRKKKQKQKLFFCSFSFCSPMQNKPTTI